MTKRVYTVHTCEGTVMRVTGLQEGEKCLVKELDFATIAMIPEADIRAWWEHEPLADGVVLVLLTKAGVIQEHRALHECEFCYEDNQDDPEFHAVRRFTG